MQHHKRITSMLIAHCIINICAFQKRCMLKRWICIHTAHAKHTHTHPFNGPFSGTTRVGRYLKGKTNLDFTEARDSEWQWHQNSGIMQVCTSLQTDNHASTSPLSFFTGRMPFLPPNQQRQSTEGTILLMPNNWKKSCRPILTLNASSDKLQPVIFQIK